MATDDDLQLTPEQMAKLAPILDRLYELQLERINGNRHLRDVDADIEELTRQRDAIRAWGWNTGRNWKDDVPPEILKKLLR